MPARLDQRHLTVREPLGGGHVIVVIVSRYLVPDHVDRPFPREVYLMTVVKTPVSVDAMPSA